MISRISFPLAAATIMLSASAATAQSAQPAETKWFVHAGVTRLTLADKITLDFAGAPVPGAGIHTKSHYTPTVAVGRFIGEHFALSLTVGIPPHIEIQGAGALQPFGKLAETTYGPSVATIQYHPLRTGPVQPYAGVGVSYMKIFSTKDAAFQNVRIDDDVAPALEAGTDIMLARRFGIFLDVKKAFLRTTAYGTFSGAPVVGKVKLDPWALTSGVVFNF